MSTPISLQSHQTPNSFLESVALYQKTCRNLASKSIRNRMKSLLNTPQDPTLKLVSSNPNSISNFPPLQRQCPKRQRKLLAKAAKAEKKRSNAYEKEQQGHFNRMQKLKEKTRRKLLNDISVGMEELVVGRPGIMENGRSGRTLEDWASLEDEDFEERGREWEREEGRVSMGEGAMEEIGEGKVSVSVRGVTGEGEDA